MQSQSWSYKGSIPVELDQRFSNRRSETPGCHHVVPGVHDKMQTVVTVSEKISISLLFIDFASCNLVHETKPQSYMTPGN